MISLILNRLKSNYRGMSAATASLGYLSNLVVIVVHRSYSWLGLWFASLLEHLLVRAETQNRNLNGETEAEAVEEYFFLVSSLLFYLVCFPLHPRTSFLGMVPQIVSGALPY